MFLILSQAVLLNALVAIISVVGVLLKEPMTFRAMRVGVVLQNG